MHQRVHRPSMADGKEFYHLPFALRGCPFQLIRPDKLVQVDSTPLDPVIMYRICPHCNTLRYDPAGIIGIGPCAGIHDDWSNGEGYRYVFTVFHPAAYSRPDLLGIQVFLMVEQPVKKVVRTLRPVVGVSTHPDTHIVFGTFFRNLRIDFPPLLREDIGLLLFCRPSGCIIMRIIHLYPTDALLVEFPNLFLHPFSIQVATCPPPEGNFAITRWRFLKSRQHIQSGRTVGITGRKPVLCCQGEAKNREKCDC